MDKYDKAVAYLTENPGEIADAWGEPQGHDLAGCLFTAVVPSPSSNNFPFRDDGRMCGCLTFIRGSQYYVAWTTDLTEAIRLDDRLPEDGEFITVADLHVFAEWQRRIDKELGRA